MKKSTDDDKLLKRAPTSRQEYEGVKRWAASASDEQLTNGARGYTVGWQLQAVDNWAARDLPSLAAVRSEAETVTLLGLERLREHFLQRLEVVNAELQLRGRRKGHPSKPDSWLLAIFYFELKGRKLEHDARRMLKKYRVSARTLQRARDPFG